jgi:D-arabinose 1-dehydrogenase-like Zn-dependent alcohol dehydrogenase
MTPAGQVRSVRELLENINDIFARIKAGKITGRVVLDLS